MIERGFTFEIQHRVHDVLERFRAGDPSAFRHVADDENGRTAFFRVTHETRGAFAYLSHVSRSAFEIRREHRLDGIDDQNGGMRVRGGRENRFQIRLAEERHVRRAAAEPVGAQLHLER